MLVPMHSSPPVSRHRHAARKQTALGGIKRSIPDVPDVDLPEQRIGLPHALKDGHCSDPERNAQADSPPAPQTECETDSGEHGNQHQFPIPAKDLVWSVCRLVDHDLSWPVGSRHGYTTAALTPNALASKGAAKTSTETTRPIMQARRPNSVSSQPRSISPPAMPSR